MPKKLNSYETKLNCHIFNNFFFEKMHMQLDTNVSRFSIWVKNVRPIDFFEPIIFNAVTIFDFQPLFLGIKVKWIAVLKIIANHLKHKKTQFTPVCDE